MIPKYIILHHSKSSKDKTTVSDIDQWHKGRGFTKSTKGFYVGYHFVILGNGVINQTRKDSEVGHHAKANDMNFNSVGIVLTGNFELEEPNEIQLESLKKLIGMIDKKYPNLPILAHKEVPANTACCGKNLIKWLNNYRDSDNKDDKKKLLSLLAEATEIAKKL